MKYFKICIKTHWWKHESDQSDLILLRLSRSLTWWTLSWWCSCSFFSSSSLLKWSSCNSQTSTGSKFVLCFLLKRHFFHFFFTFLSTFTSFIFHLYLIRLMFYSHPSQCLEFILFAVLSTHFLLHQYFISFFPPFSPVVAPFLFLFLLFLPAVSSCHVSPSWHLRSLWPARCLTKSFFMFLCVSCLPPPLFFFSSFIRSLLSLARAPQVSSADEPELFVVRWSSTLSYFCSRRVSWGCVQTRSVVPRRCEKKLLLCL